jgi:hypothetical protein
MARKGLLRCRCGFPIGQNKTAEFLLKEDLWLLDLIRRKALGAVPRVIDSWMPEELLALWSLGEVLSLVRLLTNYRIMANGKRLQRLDRHAIRAAANVLKNWPVHFHHLLQELHSRPLDQSELGTHEDWDDIYEAIQKRTAHRFASLAR